MDWLPSVIAALAAAGGAWGAVRIELKYMRRDLDEVRAVVGRMRLYQKLQSN